MKEQNMHINRLLITLSLITASSCGGEFVYGQDDFCSLDHLGDAFSLDNKAYMLDDLNVYAMGANISVTSTTKGKEGYEFKRGEAWIYSKAGDETNTANNYIFMNPSYIVNGVFDTIILLHEIGHAVFLKGHPFGESYKEIQANTTYTQRYYNDGCSRLIMDTYTPIESTTEQCYEAHKEDYKAQFNTWVEQYYYINHYKCKGRKISY